MHFPAKSQVPVNLSTNLIIKNEFTKLYINPINSEPAAIISEIKTKTLNQGRLYSYSSNELCCSKLKVIRGNLN